MATDVPGTSFVGDTGEAVANYGQRQQQLVELAERAIPAVIRRFHQRSLAEVKLDRSGRVPVFRLTDRNGVGLTLRVDAIPLPPGMVAQGYVNTTSDNHVMQLSAAMSPGQVGRAVSHELSRLVAIRRRDPGSSTPHHRNTLTDSPTADLYTLSDEDHGRLGELAFLSAQMRDEQVPQRRRQTRDELSVLVDRLGLRPLSAPGSAGYQRETLAAAIRLQTAFPHLTREANADLRELGVPIGELPAADAAALRAFRARAKALPRAVTVVADLPGVRPDGTVMSRSELVQAASDAAQARTDLSRETLADLRAETARTGKWPARKVMLGGGAALSARDPEALLVDGRGRWHREAGKGVVQSADHYAHLHFTGAGNAHQFSGSGRRVSAATVQLWQDNVAVRGPVVDGHATLMPGHDGGLFIHVKPNDGSEPLYVEVDGTPTLGTGLPAERVPGVDRQAERLPDAVNLIHSALPGSSPLHRELAGTSTARQVLDLLRHNALDGPLRRSAATRGAMQSLDAFHAWDQAKMMAPSRVLFGDDIADNRRDFDPSAANTWLVAGAGGSAVTNAEIILERNPHAQVTIVGVATPAILEENAQFLAMRRTFDATLGGDGRLNLQIDAAKRIGAVQTLAGDDGRIHFRQGGVEAEAYVSCIGRPFVLPPAVRELREWARTSGGEMSGDLMFDQHRQYLGFGLTFKAGDREHRVEVTGGGSYFPPAEVFPAQLRADLARMGMRQLPEPTANPPGGYLSAAWQGLQLAKARLGNTIERRTTIPPEWQPVNSAVARAAGAVSPSPAIVTKVGPAARTTVPAYAPSAAAGNAMSR